MSWRSAYRFLPKIVRFLRIALAGLSVVWNHPRQHRSDCNANHVEPLSLSSLVRRVIPQRLELPRRRRRRKIQ